mmetsp:Transcript_26299/g.47131  ORF Transcript_26299/g.47131 Transcript_26299/m.47131 type:complete len:166 (-) Transcript_26299:24-521(-)
MNLSPEICTKIRRVQAPKLYPKAHQLPKKSRYFAVMSQVSPDKEKVLKSVSAKINFGKMSERKDLFSPTNSGPFTYDVKFEALDKHVKSPNLGSSIGRQFDSGPCYMNSLSNRLGVEEKSWKSLEMNCYANIGFYSMETTQRHSKMPTVSIEDLQDLPLIDSFFA